MDKWDPRKDDYECDRFNTYDRGPGQYLPSKSERSKTDGVQLYITGIPNEMTEAGLYNLFAHVGSCLTAKKCVSKNPELGNTYGFVTMATLADAETAITQLNNFSGENFRLRVRVAMSDEEVKKRNAKRKEEEEFLKSLSSQRGFGTNGERASGTSSDTDSSSGNHPKKVNGFRNDPPGTVNGYAEDGRGLLRHPPGGYHSRGGNPYESNIATGILGEAPAHLLHQESELQSVDPAVLHYQKSPTLNERFNIIENFSQGQGRGRGLPFRGGPWRGRGNWNFQGGMQNQYYGRGYGRGYHQNYQPRGYYRGRGRSFYGNMGYGRGQPYPRHDDFHRQNYHHPHYQECCHYQGHHHSCHYGSRESLASTASAAPPKPKTEKRPCVACQKPGNFVCSRCKTPYCSAECQQSHWPEHASTCKEITAIKKRLEKENEGFDISIGGDLIQKMIKAGAVEKLEVEVKKDGETKVTKENLSTTIETKTPKKETPKKESKTPSKGSKSSPTWNEAPAEAKKSPGSHEEAADKRGNKSIAVPDMVPLQVQRRSMDSLKKSPTQAPPMSKIKGKHVKTPDITIGSEALVIVSEVSSPEEIWLQVVDFQENIQAVLTLMNEMKKLYEGTVDQPCSPEIGGVYGAQYSLDNNWYRARVDSLHGSDMVSVTYIDYGNKETLTNAKLRQLQDDMASAPAMAVECSLRDICPVGNTWEGAKEMLVSLIPTPEETEGAYSIQFCDRRGDKYTVVMLDRNGDDVAEKLVAAGIAKPCGASAAPPLNYGTLPLNKEVTVLAIDVASPYEIWVQEGDERKIKHASDVSEQLNKMIKENRLKDASDIRVGEMYAAFCAGYNCWFRAKADIVTEGEPVTVTYVDYGNKEQVSVTQIKDLDPAIKTEPFAAVHCVLDGVAPLPQERGWSDTAIAALREFVLLASEASVLYQATALRQTDTTTVIRMTDSQGADIAEKLVEAGVAIRVDPMGAESSAPAAVVASAAQQESSRPITEHKRICVMAKAIGCVVDKLEPNEMVSIMITDVNTPVDFVIQLNQENLIKPFMLFSENINKILNNYTDGYRPSKVGELVLGWYEGAWYRAEVLTLNDQDAHVRYIDFGNNEIKKFSQMAAAIEGCDELAAQSVRCSLHRVTPPTDWPQDILSMFRDLVSEPLDAEFKCISNGIALMDIKIGNDKLSVSDIIQQELQEIVVKESPVTVPVPSSTGESASTHSVNPDQVSTAAKPSAQTAGPVMAASITMESLPLDHTELLAAVSSIEDFESFYIQLSNSESKIAYIQENISVYCDSCTESYKPIQGELICAKFSSDGRWYRAKVLDVQKDGQVNAQFVDYGNAEPIETENIRKIHPALTLLPIQAIHCKLSKVSNEGQTLETLTAFSQCVGISKVRVEAIGWEDSVYSVLLTGQDGLDINNMFKTRDMPSPHTETQDVGGAIKLSPHPEEKPTGNLKLSDITKILPKTDEVEVIITYVESPEEFYCQLSDIINIQALTLLVQNIMLHCEMSSPDPSFNPNIGDLCCAFFREDESWYRAEVRNVFQDNTIQVHYIDFGNTETVPKDKIRRIIPDYVELPVPAFRCSLQGVQPLGTSWSREAAEKIKTYYNKRLSARVFERREDLFVLELTDGDVNLSNHLVEAGFARRPEAAAPNAVRDSVSEEEQARIRDQIAALQAQLQALGK